MSAVQVLVPGILTDEPAFSNGDNHSQFSIAQTETKASLFNWEQHFF